VHLGPQRAAAAVDDRRGDRGGLAQADPRVARALQEKSRSMAAMMYLSINCEIDVWW
jgi:hypothetical protein